MNPEPEDAGWLVVETKAEKKRKRRKHRLVAPEVTTAEMIRDRLVRREYVVETEVPEACVGAQAILCVGLGDPTISGGRTSLYQLSFFSSLIRRLDAQEVYLYDPQFGPQASRLLFSPDFMGFSPFQGQLPLSLAMNNTFKNIDSLLLFAPHLPDSILSLYLEALPSSLSQVIFLGVPAHTLAALLPPAAHAPTPHGPLFVSCPHPDTLEDVSFSHAFQSLNWSVVDLQ